MAITYQSGRRIQGTQKDRLTPVIEKYNNGWIVNSGTKLQINGSGSASLASSGSFTLSFWWKPHSITAEHYLFNKIGGTSQDYSPRMYQTIEGKLKGTSTTNGVGYGGQAFTTNTMNVGEWNHVIFKQTGNSIYVILNDGASGSAAVISGNNSGDDFTFFDSATGTDGTIKYLAYYGSALSATDITKLYNGGVPIDVTGAFVTSNLLVNQLFATSSITTAKSSGSLGGTVTPTSGTVATNAGHTILKFNNSGKFIPKGSFNVECLVVAGGGGGGGSSYNNHGSGAGGAGGFRTSTSLGVTAQTYDVTVGAGGAGGNGNVQGVNGSDSIFSTITSSGGGGGGYGGNNINGTAGGSGGGGSRSLGTNNGAGNTPSTSPSQGNNGGTGNAGAAYYAGGGGGGAGAVGQNAQPYAVGGSSGQGGYGGSGKQFATGDYYAGGGGGGGHALGGVGGLGGGGAGANNAGTSGADGYVNSGGGGGGCMYRHKNTGGDGGSGIIIIKIPKTADYVIQLNDTQIGSKYAETDTNSVYNKDDVGFKEEDGNEPTNYTHSSIYTHLSGELE